ncbi:MAG: PEP-CTERM sorting domain-containing protein [Verrucomicrobiota bacterium]
MKSIPRLFTLAVLALAFGFTSARATNIINAAFTSTGANQPLDGTTVGLSNNAPGGTWVFGAGVDYDVPKVNATWLGGILNAAGLGNENSALGISISSSGGYVKPTEFTLTSDIYLWGNLNNVAGLGFWSTMPARVNYSSPYVGFTGLILNEVNGTLQVYASGSLQGGAVSVGTIVEDTPFTISYTVNTTSGEISGVTFGGNAVSGLSSTAFTDSATSFVGALAGSSSRGSIDNLSVVSVPEPSTGALLLLSGLFFVNRRRANRR